MRDQAVKTGACMITGFFQEREIPIGMRGTLHGPCFALGSVRSDSSDSLINHFRVPPGYRLFWSPSETVMKPKRTILCVDDNEQSLSIRKVMLETRGYRVLSFTSTGNPLERFKQGGVDLVLTSLVMAGLDGNRLIEEIKNLSPQTPAILLSGRVRLCGQDTRADVLLSKGMYAPAELLERIRLLLVRKRGPKRAQALAPAVTAQTTAA
jgi:two-component system, OmpR family, response regulator CpxR